jgi:regulatory protein YycI of two-component signal transduction system YycFG
MELWKRIVLFIFIILFIIMCILYFKKLDQEHYKVATDQMSNDMFEKLKLDLSKLYPHQLSNLDLKGLVSCVPEDSFTEDKKKVCICLRNKNGEFYPYAKLLKIGIHELAHVMSKQHDPEHTTPEFINNYTYLMNKAYELGFTVE